MRVPDTSEVKAVAEREQCSWVDARYMIERDIVENVINEAKTVADLKPALRWIIEKIDQQRGN